MRMNNVFVSIWCVWLLVDVWICTVTVVAQRVEKVLWVCPALINTLSVGGLVGRSGSE